MWRTTISVPQLVYTQPTDSLSLRERPWRPFLGRCRASTILGSGSREIANDFYQNEDPTCQWISPLGVEACPGQGRAERAFGAECGRQVVAVGVLGMAEAEDRRAGAEAEAES